MTALYTKGQSYATLLSVICLSSVTSWYRFETAQRSGQKILADGRAGSWLLWCQTASKKTEPFLISGGYSGGTSRFLVDRDRIYAHIFGSVARRKLRTAKIMAPYYRQLFMGNPMALTPLSVAAVHYVRATKGVF